MERVKFNEVSSAAGLEKVLNRIIDRLNENDEYNELVDKHNEGLIDKKGE